jgi:hypothetical protein
VQPLAPDEENAYDESVAIGTIRTINQENPYRSRLVIVMPLFE